MASNEFVKPEASEAVTETQRPRRPSSTDTERPPSGQRPKEDVKGERSNDEGHEDYVEADDDDYEDEFDDPAVKIPDLDWDDLERRYHDKIRESQHNEAELLKEFDQLMAFFKIWSESGSNQETSRTYSRLKTRMAHVQHSEENLEEKRQHYNKVVDAFKSALELLQGQFRG